MVKVGLSKQLTISISKGNINKLAKKVEITPKQFIMLLKSVLSETLMLTMKDMQQFIIRFVPKRTGQLQYTLLKKMESSKIRDGVLIFIIGTHLRYARDVNQMATSQVQHSSHKEHSGKWAYAYYYGHKGRIFLYDPEAIGSFWQILLMYLQKRILIHLQDAMRKQYGDTKLPWVIN